MNTATLPLEDPLVEEVRERRRRLVAGSGGLDGLLEAIRRLEEGDRHRVVDLRPKTAVSDPR
jgi:hypothetical protein